MFGVLLLDLVAPLRAETVLSVLPVSAGLLDSVRVFRMGCLICPYSPCFSASVIP